MTTATPGGSRRWWALAVLGLGVAIIVIDITIINVALPRIITDLDLEVVDAEWINTIYALTFATLLITLGRLGDLFGRKRLFVAGLVVFVVASAMAGQAGALGGLVLARTIQGVGAAMILPATLSTVNATFRGRDRAIAFGIWGSIIGGMAAIGPLVGGWLTTSHSWRWAFYINVPIGLATLAAAWVLVAESRERQHREGFDIPGFLAVTAGLFGLVLALIEGTRYGWFTPKRELQLGGWEWPLDSISIVPFALVLGVIGLGCFAVVERRRSAAGRPVLFDLSLFRLRSFLHGNFIATIVGLGEFGLVFVLPLYLQTVLRYSAFETGVLFVAMAAGGFIGGPLAAGLAHWKGPRQVVTLGMGLEAVGVLSAAVMLSPTLAGGVLAPSLFIYGVGVGLASAQLTSVILFEVPTEKSGQASGMQSTFRQVGAAVGIALLGTVYVTSLGSITSDHLDAIPALTDRQHANVVEGVVDSAGWYIEALRAWTPDFQVVTEAVADSISDSARRAALLAFGFFIVGVFLSRRLPDIGKTTRAGPKPEEAGVGAAGP